MPLQRGTTPEEIAAAVRFILSAPAMTGQMIALDGGQHLGWAQASGRPTVEESEMAMSDADLFAAARALGADKTAGFRRILVRDLVLQCEIGVFRHERGARQRVRINLDLAVREDGVPIADDLRNVVCYDEIVSAIRQLSEAGHFNLVETLAERIAEYALPMPASASPGCGSRSSCLSRHRQRRDRDRTH